MLIAIVSRGRLRGVTRAAAAAVVAVLATAAALGGLLATPAAAATTVQLTQNLPATPLQVAVGDQINLTLPPATPAIPAGYTGPASVKYPAPTSSDGTVLPLTNATYDSGGTEHATFQAASSGTAQLHVIAPSYSYCRATTSTSTSTSATATTTTTIGATAPPAPPSCVVIDPVLQTATVVVSGTGVQGVSVTTPGTGSGGSSTAGLGIAVLGLMVTGGTLVRLRGRRLR